MTTSTLSPSAPETTAIEYPVTAFVHRFCNDKSLETLRFSRRFQDVKVSVTHAVNDGQANDVFALVEFGSCDQLVQALGSSSARTVCPGLQVSSTSVALNPNSSCYRTFPLTENEAANLVGWLRALKIESTQPATRPDFEALHRVTIQKLDDVQAAIQELRSALTQA